MGLLDGISLDVFDIKAAEKMFDDIAKNANMIASFSKEDIAKKLGLPMDSFSLPNCTDSTPCGEVLSNIGDPKLRGKVNNALKDLRAEQIGGEGATYDSLSESQKTQIDVECGTMNKDIFVNNAKAKWLHDATHKKTRGFGDIQDPNARPTDIIVQEKGSYQRLTKNAAAKPNAKERDQQTCVVKTKNNSGIYINEETEEDPNSMNIFYCGKQSGIRLNKEGMLFSTDQSLKMRVGGEESIQVDGCSKKSINGSLDLIISGPVRIAVEGDITISATGDINFTAGKNINMQTGASCTLQTSGNFGVISNGETVLNSGAKMSFLTSNSLHLKTAGGCCFGGQGAVSMKGGGNLSIDAAQVSINGGSAEDATPKKLSWVDTPTAVPTKPNVPKV